MSHKSWNMIKPTASSRAGSPMATRAKFLSQNNSSNGQPATVVRLSRPLVGNFEENILHNRLDPIRTVDGYMAEVRASSSHFQPSPLRSKVRMSFFSMGDSFPYLGQVHLGARGYKIPKRGSVQVALFNPLGTLVKLFLLIYDLTDMPPNSQTFLRQKTLFLPKTYAHNTTNNKINENDDAKQEETTAPSAVSRRRIKYMIQLNIVSSESGRIYLNRDVRIFISKKSDLETASKLAKQDYEVKAFNEMPSNPRYYVR